MALETGDYIDDLVATNPTGSDNRSEGDDHFRLIKSVLKRMFKKMREYGAIPFSAVTIGANTAWDSDTSPNGTLALTRNTTLSITNAKDGGVYTLVLTQDGTGSRTVTFPSTWRWAGGEAGMVSSAANSIDILMVRRIGNNYYANLTNDWS